MNAKWLQEKSYREKSDKRVKSIAKKTGGKTVVGSGSTPMKKGDIVYPDTLLEHKQTSKKSFKLDRDILAKIYHEALKSGKEPVLMIDFGTWILVGKVERGK